MSKIKHFEVFSCLQENQLAQHLWMKFNLLLCSFSFRNVLRVFYGFMPIHRKIVRMNVFKDKTQNKSLQYVLDKIF